MKIVIIGNGIAGITAARYIRKQGNDEICVISSESKKFYSRPALMYIYMGHMKYEHTKPYEDWFWEKNKIDLIYSHITSVDTDNKYLFAKNGTKITYDKLILATGSKTNKFGWPGQNLKGVGGLYSLQDLEYIEQYSAGLKHAVIVGGGLIGIEMAEMFLSRGIGVTFLVREMSYWDRVLPPQESEMVNRHILEHGIDLRLNSELVEILADENGKARAVIAKNNASAHNEEISCGFVGITAGVSPNIDFLEGSQIATSRGVLVNDYFETNIKDVYAIGDCVEFSNPPEGGSKFEQIWYTGKIHGQMVSRAICGDKQPYKRAIWYNSAKFLDIEYQVYGAIQTGSENTASIYWEHPAGKKSIRLEYDKNNRQILGFNLMGIRYRHAVCEKWLMEEKSIDYVLAHLREANFDPEFFHRYESELISLFEGNRN